MHVVVFSSMDQSSTNREWQSEGHKVQSSRAVDTRERTSDMMSTDRDAFIPRSPASILMAAVAIAVRGHRQLNATWPKGSGNLRSDWPDAARKGARKGHHSVAPGL